jgi:Cu+-exporting ATPase
MTCAACAKRIEKTIGKLAGVSTATVNFATEKATVTYDPASVKLSRIKDAISSIGYTPLEMERKGAVDEDKIRKEREIRVLRRKFIVSALFGTPLLSPPCWTGWSFLLPRTTKWAHGF